MGTRWQSGLHHPVSVYAKQATRGRLRDQCCEYEILACQRHLDDLKRQGTEEFPYVFDTTRADRIIRWFGQCVQIRGVDAGKPIVLEPWQVFDLGRVYGWVHKDTGARRFTHTYNKRARGNYKSTEKSAQGLYHMCADAMYPPYKPEEAVFEQEPEVECAAVDRGQAMRVFGDAKKIARASPNIAKRVLADPAVVNESYFVMVRELDENDNPHDERVWRKANPCLRYPSEYSAILLKQIRDEHNTAYSSNEPNKIRKFLTRRMCRWQTGSPNRYLDEKCMALAKAAMIPPAEFASLTDGLECHCGFDLGKRIDLSGAAAVFDLPDGRIALKLHGFMPENGAQRHEHTDRVPYIAWAKDGYCTLTPGDVTDNSYVYSWICAGEREHGWQVEEVDYDGHNATDLAIRMNEDRNREDFCVEVSQTCAGQNLAVKTFRELLLQGRVVLEENPMVLWCLGNAVEIQNNYGDIKLSKRHKDDTERIDPVAAAMNALARVLVKRNAKPDLAEAIRTRDYHL